MGLSFRGLVALALGTSFLLVGTFAQAKDRDGTRLRAKAVKMAKKISDKLDGAADKADWRYVELREAKVLKISVAATPKTGNIALKVVDANGKPVTTGACKAGVCTLSKELQPGIYYIEVSAGSALAYTIEVNNL